MSGNVLPILQHPGVLERTSFATQRVLELRSQPKSLRRAYLPPELFALLHEVTATVIPQTQVDTQVDIAAAIDNRLAEGKNTGWRFAVLPEDGEAYRQGLTAFAAGLDQTAFRSFEQMPKAAREEYLRSVAEGNMDEAAQFPLSKWFVMLRTDAVKAWLAHPSTMHKMNYYGFADGRSGDTNGPTEIEGWSALTPNTSLPFERENGATAGQGKA